MLASDDAALTVTGIAVAIVGRFAKHRSGPGFFIPAVHAVARHIAPHQRAHVAQPHRPFGPAQARGQPFDLGQTEAVTIK